MFFLLYNLTLIYDMHSPQELNVSNLANSLNYPYWLVSVGGLPVVGLTIAHAIVSHAKAAKILGMIVSS